jgi:hypothetical protein
MMSTKKISPSGSRYNFLIVFIAALGSFTYGFNMAIIGSVFGLPGFFAVSACSRVAGFFDLCLSTSLQSQQA